MGISSKLASFQFHSRQGNPFQGSPLRQLQAPGLTSFLRTIRAADFLAPQPLFAWQLCSLSRAWISIRIWPFPLTSNSSIFFPQFLTSYWESKLNPNIHMSNCSNAGQGYSSHDYFCNSENTISSKSEENICFKSYESVSVTTKACFLASKRKKIFQFEYE